MRQALIVVLVLAMATTAGASEPEPHVTDPCGDAGALVWAGDDYRVEPGERSDGFDIKAVWLDDVLDGDIPTGVRITLELCGDVPEPTLPYTMWSVEWSLDDGCNGYVYLADAPTEDGGLERISRLSSSCPVEPLLPLPGSAAGASRFGVDAPDVTVEGATITWVLSRDAFDGEPAELLEPGTVWSGPGARTRDTGGTFFSMSVGNAGTQAGATDSTARGAAFVVGG